VLYYEEDASVVVGADDFSIYYATKLFNLWFSMTDSRNTNLAKY
jgi:hypothetical protein